MFPIRDNVPGQRPVPIVTTSIILINVAVFVFQLTLSDQQLENLIYLFGIVPRRFTHPLWASWVGYPDNYWPFLTSMFLHGGWLHIIVNMWILWIFGDNVEDRMGHLRFVAFYLLCGMVAGVVHLLTNGNSRVPVIGASGAIAGVLAAYVFLFPMARIVCVVPIFFYPLFIEVRAFFYMFFWFVMQFFSGTLALTDSDHAGGIAWWAHIGGFVFGIAAYRFFLPRKVSEIRMRTWTL
ncbi:MAG TPA: rhomboid family intramembrane serine protease [Candidatus Hydrogenedentes bacterium]|nr:rhomboid family intramembrane serine protease [Candidatus Hydrogenedentota bacterium]